MQINPYAERGTVRDAERFFGRTRELDEILSRLATMQSISVVGERRIGKSSLLYHIAQTGTARLGTAFTFCYLDLQGVLSAEEFYERACELLDTAGSTHRDLERAIRGKKIVLCLDEFEQTTANPEFGTDFFNVLRSFAQTGELALVIATQRTLSDLYRVEAIPTSPFSNIFTLLRLGPLTDAEARELVTRPAEQVGQSFTEPEVDFILGVAGTHPYRLNIASTLLYEAKLSGRVDFTQVRWRFEEEVGDGQPVRARQTAPTATARPPTVIAGGALGVLGIILGWLSVQVSSPFGVFLAGGFLLIALGLWILDLVALFNLRRSAR